MLFAWGILGFFIQKEVEHLFVKVEMQELMQSKAPKEKVVLTFSAEEYQELVWIKSHEFKYKNDMYDVVSSEQEDDTIIVECFKDSKEKEFYEELKEELDEEEHQSKNSKRLILKLNKTPFFNTVENVCFNFSEAEFHVNYTPYKRLNPHGFKSEVKSPPQVC